MYARTIRHMLPGSQAARREIQRLVEAKITLSPEVPEVAEIQHRSVRIDHRSQRSGIGRDDQIFGKAPLDAEARYPENSSIDRSSPDRAR